jgi:single-strand DNA-binding protein
MYNEIHLIGRVGSDPESKQIGENKAATFSLAWNKKKGDQQKTTWFRVTAWRQTADIVEKFVKKGDLLHVVGELDITEKDGKTFVGVTASTVTLINPKAKEAKPDPEPAAMPPNAPPVDDLPF